MRFGRDWGGRPARSACLTRRLAASLCGARRCVAFLEAAAKRFSVPGRTAVLSCRIDCQSVYGAKRLFGAWAHGWAGCQRALIEPGQRVGSLEPPRPTKTYPVRWPNAMCGLVTGFCREIRGFRTR